MNYTALPITTDARGLTPQERTRILHYLTRLGIRYHRYQIERIHRDQRHFWYPATQSKEVRA